MSATYLSAMLARASDVGMAGVAGSNRQKIVELSDKVVDSNPYSRLMCVRVKLLGARNGEAFGDSD